METITKNHTLSQSQDIVADNMEKLKQLFPHIFTEGNIDFEALKATLGENIEPENELYQFTWKGKAKAMREAHKTSTGTLRPCPEESVNWNNTENLFLEGDNLEVLKLLQKSYHGRVKMIYIDPPYNTGKDFVYKDNYKDNLRNYQEFTGQINSEGLKQSTNSETSGRYHSNWLNMIYPRLKLARNLLKEDGVIFISIDDNESENLKKICCEIFGEDNFVAMITNIVKTEGRRYGFFAKTHEYILVFAKDINHLQLNELEVVGKDFRYTDSFGGFDLKELRNQNTRAFNSLNRPNLRYSFYVNVNSPDKDGLMQLSVDPIQGYKEVYPIEVDGLKSVWRWGKDTARLNSEKSLIARKGTDGIIRIFQKYRSSTQAAKTVWFDKDIISIKGTKMIQELFDGKSVFDFPKPVSLIDKLVEIGTGEDDIVLDFFSGSATTAHAVLESNKKDDGSRKFILVQLPENLDNDIETYKAGFRTIADIGKERIRRVINKIKTEEPLTGATMDLGFKVFKLDSSNLRPWDPNPEELEKGLFESVDNIKAGRKEADILYEILLKYGLDLTLPIQEQKIAGNTVYNIGAGALLVCLSRNITLETVGGIGELKEDLAPEICRVVFRDNGFKDDVAKTNAMQILKRYGIEDVKSI